MAARIVELDDGDDGAYGDVDRDDFAPARGTRRRHGAYAPVRTATANMTHTPWRFTRNGHERDEFDDDFSAVLGARRAPLRSAGGEGESESDPFTAHAAAFAATTTTTRRGGDVDHDVDRDDVDRDGLDYHDVDRDGDDDLDREASFSAAAAPPRRARVAELVDERDLARDGDGRSRWQLERANAVDAAVGEERAALVQTQTVARQYARLVAVPLTEHEVEHQVDNDDDALRWTPVLHPDYADIERELGPPQPRSDCWGCTHGNKDMSAASARRLDEMQTMYLDNRTEMAPAALARELERYYERYVRAPTSNPRVRRNGELELPPWRAATIYDHFTNHRAEPGAKLVKRLAQVATLNDHIFHNGLFRAPATHLRDGGADVRRDEVRVNDKYFRQFMSGIAMELRLYAAVPAKMFGHNQNVSMETRATHFVRDKYNVATATRKRRRFDAMRPAQL